MDRKICKDAAALGGRVLSLFPCEAGVGERIPPNEVSRFEPMNDSPLSPRVAWGEGDEDPEASPSPTCAGLPGKVLVSWICARCVHKSETLPGHGRDSLHWKSRHRTEAGGDFARSWHHRLEEEAKPARQAGFRVPPGAAGRLCGWVFLARVPLALPETQKPESILDSQDRSQSKT